MAFEQNLQVVGFEAAADLSTKQFYAVNLDTTGKVAVAGAGKNIDGFLQNKPSAAGQAATVGRDGFTKAAITASTAISIGDLLEVDTGGTLIVKSSGFAIAKAMEALSSTAAVRLITVEILRSNAAFV